MNSASKRCAIAFEKMQFINERKSELNATISKELGVLDKLLKGQDVKKRGDDYPLDIRITNSGIMVIRGNAAPGDHIMGLKEILDEEFGPNTLTLALPGGDKKIVRKWIDVPPQQAYSYSRYAIESI